MTTSRDAAARYDGHTAAELAVRLALPRVVLLDDVSSTLDVAHELAAGGAPAGTLVVANSQRAGRGRQGRRWHSDAGRGVWITIIERPADATALELLSLRVGLGLAPALDDITAARERVRLKWPNDLHLSAGKLAGVLSEARWRDGGVEWIAIGAGINVEAPSIESPAAGLRPGTTRLDVLARAVPALRAAAGARGALSDEELSEFASRDIAAGRTCLEPVAGRVRGIDRDGALLVEAGTTTIAIRAGSLVLEGT
jgi:BirA family transcriptional regulator, biotin operon repressor / biotin---[acetyl-CoA-carboxylase] ligase